MNKYTKINNKKHLFNSQNVKCKICLYQLDSIITSPLDHIIPKGLGGSDDITNLQLLCIPCHKKKTKKDMKTIRDAKHNSLNIKEDINSNGNTSNKSGN